jgi:tRNA-specific 2-thiouridylase
MYRGIDLNRDQSYFLFSTTKVQLNFLRFPLGNLLNVVTRNIARELNLNVADKPDSQDICFVPNGDYASVIEKFRPNSFNKGNIKNMNGEVIGVHDGIINYTIGQRKGIGISDKKPLYVVKIIADKNEIIVGDKKNLVKNKIKLKDFNIITKDQSDFTKELLVKVRSTGRLIKAKIDISNTSANVDLLEEEHGIAPGQACVFYLKNDMGFKVLGGGWIKS